MPTVNYRSSALSMTDIVSDSAAHRSILVIRLSAMGDVVMASGLVGALRARYPGARLAWLVQPEAKDLLAANPALDEVIIWPRGEWRRLARTFRWWRLAREMRAFTATLKALRFDLAIDAQGLLKSSVWAWLSGARERIGLRPKEGSQRLMTRVVEPGPQDRFIGSEYRHLSRSLGFDGEYRMQVVLTEDDRKFAEDVIAREGLEKGYAVICPLTTRPQKRWIEANWPRLVARLQSDLGLRAIMLGGPGDRVAAERIGANSGALLVDAAGKTTLRQAAALIERARLLAGVDTGLTHMGTAFSIPTIAIFGSTCPYLSTASAKTTVLYKQLDCSPCRRHPTCDGAYTCMRMITVDDIIEAARRIVQP